MDNNDRQEATILITGATGMLGGYIKEIFKQNDNHLRAYSLGRSSANDFICDLTSDIPDFRHQEFGIVVHCAGTEEKKPANSLNYDGTARLLKALDTNPPSYFIYISSYKVYGPDAGTDVTEETPAWTVGECGESKIKAERLVTDWAEEHHVTLTIIRPARMFGSRVGGETLRLFNDALNGYYIHIRGNDARVSLVTALDVATAIFRVYKTGGTYNAADGRNPRFIEMMEAMTANAGQQKRMTHLPASWAGWLWRLCRWIPAVDRNLNPETAARRMKTLTIDGSRLANISGIAYHNTIDVISRRDKTYPYAEK